MKMPENLVSGAIRLYLVAKLGGHSANFDVIGVTKFNYFLYNHPLYFTPVSRYVVGDFFYGFVHGHPFLVRIIELLRDHYDRSEYKDMPLAMKKFIKDVAGEPVENSIGKQWVKNLYIPPVEFASPVNSSSFEALFSRDGDMDVWKLLENSQVCQLGNAPAIQVNSINPLAQIARKLCPRSFWACEREFRLC
jgi:hypothetical protein